MVDKAIYEQVHRWMETHKENMINDIQRIRRGKTFWCSLQTGYG